MKLSAFKFSLMLLILLGVFETACSITLSRVSQPADEATSFIKPGITTREEVREHLGLPVASRREASIYIYPIYHPRLYVVPTLLYGLPYFTEGTKVELLIIQFDGQHVVQEVDQIMAAGNVTRNGIEVTNLGYSYMGDPLGGALGPPQHEGFTPSWLVLLAPPREDERAKRFFPPPDKCAIYYYRKEHWYQYPTANLVERVQVRLDNILMGNHRETEYFYWLVEPGRHYVSCSALDTNGLSSHSFECVAGKNYFVKQEWNVGTWFSSFEHRVSGSITPVEEEIGEREILKRQMIIESGPSDASPPGFHEGTSLPNTFGIQKDAGIYCPNADLGHPDAQLYIAKIYEYGAYEGQINLVRAWVWYSLAAQNGDPVALDKVKHLTGALNAEQLAEAKRQLVAWKPGQCLSALTQYQKRQDAK
jgi:hypothetical protein